ncbi:SpoIIE family protein phosphatase [Pseudodesulfovibrio cashew]|uniref:SpoIIE family protein phosphatase n=1 Tax=Pseudodesulfovibrio cashew TaxID=2678688 RepID=UPI001F54ACE1|nr:SpoIIE family protein phosphatase [Pseudodesulfovibrio cashew]
MKFSIRIKIFIVLVAFSMGPLLLSRTLMSRQAGKMVDQVSGETRGEMLNIIRAELEHNADSLLRYFEARGQAISLSARMLARQAEHYLVWQLPEKSSPVYYASNFHPGNAAPPDLAPSDLYLRRGRTSKASPLYISLEQPAFLLSKMGMMDMMEEPTDAGKTEEDIQRLNELTPVFKALFNEQRKDSQWFNVGLESGVFLTYPGHGHFPPHFDHRSQKWYLNARHATDEVVWTAPGIDPATRLSVSTASYPIRDKEGRFLGAASVDVPIFRIIEEAQLRSRWSGDIEAYMVYRKPGDEDRLLILAQQAYDDGQRRHWMVGIEPDWMKTDDPRGIEPLLEAMKQNKGGVVNLRHKGQNAFWAYASNDEISFILIAPDSVITRLPDQVGGTLGTLFSRIRSISSIVSGIMIVIIGLIAWFGSRAVTNPLLHMADAAKRLAKGDFSVHMDLHTGDERDELIHAFNDMGPKLQERLLLRRDLKLAQEVQNLLLPRKEPELCGFDIAGGISFCDQTGGDYYDFIEMDDQGTRSLGVVLGDVSGHGVQSALVMATTRGLLRSLSSAAISPRERIQTVNTVLSRDMDGTGRFLTLFYLRLKANSPEIQWVRAGHEPAIRYNPETGVFSELSGEGLALGVLEEFEYEDYTAFLEPGEVLVMATDGIWEARNEEGEMFGKKRMLAIVKENAHNNAETIRAALMDAAGAFRPAGQEDDIAVVVIKRDKEVNVDATTFRMTNKENCFKCFQPRVESFGRCHGLPPKAVFHLTLVLDELISNIITYGYADLDEHPIEVTIAKQDDMLTIRIEDDAEPFNILEAPEPELDTPLEERQRQIGGMGVHLVKNMVSHIKYQRSNGKNILTMTKDLKTCAHQG